MADNFYASYPVNGPGPGGDVTSLNGLTGALTLVAGSGITITPAGSNITIAATGGSGANTALSNLASVAINQPLVTGAGTPAVLSTLNAIGSSDATTLASGTAGGAGQSGTVTVTSGTSVSGASGGVDVLTGSSSANNSGALRLLTGSAVSGNTGDVTLESGGISTAGNSGALQIQSGQLAGTGNSGGVVINTGNAAVGNSGDLVLSVGTSPATRGKIHLIDGSEGTAGQVWTSTGALGEGAWLPGGTSTGPANTFAIFDNSGNLTGSPQVSFTNNATTIQAVNAAFNVANTVTDLEGFIFNPTVDGATISGGRSIEINGSYGATTATSINNQIDLQLNTDFQANATVTTYVGIGMGPRFETGATLGDFTGLNINPTLNSTAITTNFNGINVNSAGTGSATNVSGISINLNNITSTNQKQGLSVNDGALSVNSNYDTSVLTPVFEFQQNQIGGVLTVASGFPVAGPIGFGNNLGVSTIFQDNWGIDSFTGTLGFSVNGFVNQLGISPGKTVHTLNYMTAGGSVPATYGGGTATNVTMFNALGLLNGGDTVTITNLVGLRVPTGFSTMATNAWGVKVEDTNADNFFGKNVITPLVVSQEVAAPAGQPLAVHSADSVTGSSALNLYTGSVSTSGDSGPFQINSGNNAGPGDTGNMDIFSGSATSGNTGRVTLTTGASASGDTGNISLFTGIAGGTRGKIQLANGSEGTAGQVWTSTDTSGSGAWAPTGSPTGAINSVSYFNGAGTLTSDANVEYSPSITQTFPPFAVRGFFAKSDVINNANTGLVIGSTDTSTDSFTTNLGMITGANLAVAAANPTGGVLFGTGEIADAGATAATGAVNIFTGPNNGAGNSGAMRITTGQTTTSATGDIFLSSGGGGGNTGAVNIQTGASTGGSSGDLKFNAGASDGIAFNGEFAGGTAPVTAVGASADSGVVQLESGPVIDATATGASGAVTIASGDNFGLGNSGKVTLKTGPVTSGTRGQIQLLDGTEGTAGYVWTSTDTSGNGAWMAGGGGGANTSLSNLTATSINQDLISNSPNNRNLGANGNAWQLGYINLLKNANTDNPVFDTNAVQIYDSNPNLSADLNARLLIDNTGSVTALDYQNRLLIDPSGNLSANWDSRQLFHSDGVTIAFDYGALFMEDASSQLTADFSGRRLYNGGGVLTVDYGALTLSNSGVISIDWGAKQLFDGSSVNSLNYSSRNLQDPAGNSILNWNNAGSLVFPATITAGGTTGDQTIDLISGTVNFAATTSSLVVTNSTVTATSIVMAVIRTNDATATIKNVVPASGSFTIRLTAAATAETSVGFFVINN